MVNQVQELIVNDNMVCPFHNEKALGNAPKWKDCCKSDYLLRKSKSERTKNAPLIEAMTEPITEEESRIIADSIKRFGGLVASNTPFSLLNYSRLGYLDCGTVRLKILTDFVPTLTEAYHKSYLFHSVKQHRWVYIGHCPFNLPAIGIMVFVDLTLFPLTGIIEGTARTAHCLTAIIIQMKKACKEFDVPIIDATIEMQPSHKMKPDEKHLKYNQELLQKDLEMITVSQNIDKRAKEGMRRHCAYRGVDRKKDGVNLMKSPCKLAYLYVTDMIWYDMV